MLGVKMRKKKEYPKLLSQIEIKREENHLAKINAKLNELVNRN